MAQCNDQAAHSSIKFRHAITWCLLCLYFLSFAGCTRDAKQEQKGSDSTMEKAFEELVAEARGTTVRFYMWGGSSHINAWVDGYVMDEMKRRYDIVVERVPMDATIMINKLLTEKAVGKRSGTMDLLWINGENFCNGRKGDVLYGPFADKLPNMRYVDKASVATDFGYPVEGYEVPYGRAQFVFEYDSARVAVPPRTFVELRDWIERYPGRFTYPQPPDFTGSAFVRQVFYAVTGGHQQYMGGYDAALWREKAPVLWAWCRGIKPFLWRQGVIQPRDTATLDVLFARGEVDFNMAYHPYHAQSKIQKGVYPKTIRTFVMKEGALFNTHFISIAFNAPNKPGAMVLANFLLSPEAQAHKLNPVHWGDSTVLEVEKLPKGKQALFRPQEADVVTLPPEILAAHAVPEIPSAWLEAIEEGWDTHVLYDP